MQIISRITATLLAALALSVTLVACSSDGVVNVVRPDATDLLWAVRNETKAVTLAVGDSQQLVVSPRDTGGNLLSNLPVSFRSADTNKVQVDRATGMITGRLVTTGVNVIASYTKNGGTVADTSLVVVTAVRRSIKTFKINAATTPLATGATRTLLCQATDSNDAVVSGLSISFRTLDPTIGTTSSFSAFNATLRGVNAGTVGIVMSTTSYGVTRADTAFYTILYPTTASIFMYGSPMNLSPTAAAVAVDGVVTFTHGGVDADTVSVIFANGGANIDGGNITGMLRGQAIARTFRVPGTYMFTVLPSKVTGIVAVFANP